MRILIVTLTICVLAGCEAGSDLSAAQQGQSTSASGAARSIDLDSLLAPIALYPDTLLAQILLCASEPGKIAELGKWLAANTDVKGTELQDAATVDGFEPSFVALALFPQVVNYMAARLDWVTQLGKAFAANKTAVFDTIQKLRAQAQKSGALKDSPQQDVQTKTTSGGTEVIVIEPANPQVIYVPQYDPVVVYTQPTTTTVVVQENNSTDAAVAGLIGFTAGIAIGAAADNNYYYGPYGFHGGAYMYNDAWNDYYDAREDAREDWTDHREDLVEERGERAREGQEQRTDRAEGRQDTRANGQSQRTDRQQTRQENPASTAQRSQAQAATSQARSSSGSTSSGGSGTQQAARERSGTSSDAFSGYSSGKSERSASSRGQQSRSGSRGGGGGRRR
jgi:hypothetical protein